MAEKEYIEREAVINHIDFVVDNSIDTDYQKAAWGFGVFVSRLPAADVVPVRHGHWYNRGGRFRCSVCDNKALLKDIGGTGGWSHEYEQQKSPYCPNCGAKMDGE